MYIEEIKSCRMCGNTALIPILDLGIHALSGRFPAKDEPDPPEAPLVLVKCDESVHPDACGLLQLKHTSSPDEMYLHDYGYRSGLNRTMTMHLHGIVHEIESRIQLQAGDTILDIGSNDATLLKAFQAQNLKKIGIDPTGKQFEKHYTSDISLVSDYFTRYNFEKVSKEKAKAITSIAMFYDLPRPLDFVRDIKECLHQEGIWVSEQSYMPLMLERNAFDTICHEHLEYYSLKQIAWLIKKAGLKLIDVSFNDCNGGSFRFTAAHQKSEIRVNQAALDVVFKKEQAEGYSTLKPYQEFSERVEKIRLQVATFLTDALSQNKKIHLYGASTKGNTLLQYFNLGKQHFSAAAERNQEKWGRRTPKTGIPIISEEESRKEKPDYFFVLPWHFKEEFLEREKEYLLSDGKFIFPLPVFDVVGKENII